MLQGGAESGLPGYSTEPEGEKVIQRDAAVRERLIITGLIIVALATRLVYIYRGGMSEPDSVVMAAGMTRMLSPDSSFVESMLYGRQLNPGIYFIFKAIYPLIFDSPKYVIGFLNCLGVLSAALITWPLYLIFRKIFSNIISAGAVLIFIFTPITWELGTYFHPIMPALVLALISILTFNRISSSSKGVIYFVITCLAGSAAVIMRTEVLLVLPSAAVYILYCGQRRRNLFLLLSISAIAVVSYLSLVAIISPSASTGSQGLQDFAEKFMSMYFKSISMTGILK
ncbi:MAG: glycosyltransferase family 39 protein, partial [Candidatus Krumholzibacteriota bacterium]